MSFFSLWFKRKRQQKLFILILKKKEADIAAYLPVPSAERARVMDFSIHIAFAEFVLMVPYPEEENQLTAPFKPFNLTVIKCIINF